LDVFGSGKGSTHLFDSLSGVEFRAQEQAIGLFDSFDAVSGKAVAFEADGIYAVTLGFARGDDFREWWNVLGNHGVGGDVRISADAAELVHGAERADGGIVFDGYMTGERGAVDENCAASDLTIVTDVRVGHDQVVAADASGAAAFYCAAIDGGKFAEFVFIAGFERDALASIGEVLRIATDYAERVKVISFSEARGALDHGVGIEDGAFAEFDFVADNGERADFGSIANARGGRNRSARVNITHWAHAPRVPGLKPNLFLGDSPLD